MAKSQAAASHKKLKIFGIALLVLVLGFFIYKYTYIYLERRKYDQAEQAIHKVADDLHAQGIETEFSKGCVFANVEFGTGPLSCSVQINYPSRFVKYDAAETFNKFNNSLIANSFLSITESQNSSTSSETIPSKNYRLKNNDLVCDLYYTKHSSEEYLVGASCGKISKFSIF